MLGGQGGHFINICPSHQALLVTGAQLALHPPTPQDISPWVGKAGPGAPKRTTGAWSPISTHYLSPERDDAWPNKDAKCDFTKRRRCNKPLSPKMSKVDMKWGWPAHHSSFLRAEAGRPGARSLTTHGGPACALTDSHVLPPGLQEVGVIAPSSGCGLERPPCLRLGTCSQQSGDLNPAVSITKHLHHSSSSGLPGPSFQPSLCPKGACLSRLPPHNLRLASHLLLRDALKMGKNVFSQSFRGPLGPHQGSISLTKAQGQQPHSRNECSPNILSPRRVAGIISPILETGKPGPGSSFVTCPRCHDESVGAQRYLPLPLFSFPLEKKRVRKKNCNLREPLVLLWRRKA